MRRESGRSSRSLSIPNIPVPSRRESVGRIYGRVTREEIVPSLGDEDEGQNQTARLKPSSPEGSLPKEANAEVYGFVGWIISLFAIVIFLIWAYTPNSFLLQMGISYYPDKWWAIAFPTHMCVSVLFLMWVINTGINLVNTPPLHSRHYFTSDEEGTENYHPSSPGGIDAICDLPLTRVNSFLYSKASRKHRKAFSEKLE